MKNKIITTTESRFRLIKQNINPAETFLAELDGKEIQNKAQLFEVMEKVYGLRTLGGSWGKNWDALDDLMEDLWWIPEQKHILAIHNYSKIFAHDKQSKAILDDCLKCWLRFWEEDVIYYVVEGKTKDFTVYLID